jgi:hypothetical protein
MEFLYSLGSYLREHILANPIVWGIAAVVVWIVGSAFLKALRGKDRDEND